MSGELAMHKTLRAWSQLLAAVLLAQVVLAAVLPVAWGQSVPGGAPARAPTMPSAPMRAPSLELLAVDPGCALHQGGPRAVAVRAHGTQCRAGSSRNRGCPLLRPASRPVPAAPARLAPAPAARFEPVRVRMVRPHRQALGGGPIRQELLPIADGLPDRGARLPRRSTMRRQVRTAEGEGPSKASALLACCRHIVRAHCAVVHWSIAERCDGGAVGAARGGADRAGDAAGGRRQHEARRRKAPMTLLPCAGR